MTGVEETIQNEKSSERLTFRQKFWLFGVVLPVLVTVVLLALAVFLPKSLNSEERKLLGRWVFANDQAPYHDFNQFEERYYWTRIDTELKLWAVEDGVVTIIPIENSEVWTRWKLLLGITPQFTQQFQIEFTAPDRYKMSGPGLSGVFEYRRVASTGEDASPSGHLNGESER